MLRFLLIFWVIAYASVPGAVLAQPGTETDCITRYVEFFHRNVNQKRLVRAKSKIPYVLKYAEKYNLDPLLLACIMSLESSWKTKAVGARGEMGLMQVMPNRRVRQFDLTSVEGQVDAGAYVLSLSRINCDGLEQIMTHYASGRCVSTSETTKRKMKHRVRYYLRMKRMFCDGKRPGTENSQTL